MRTLRPYQAELIDKARLKLKTNRSTLIVSATGSGKTALSAYMLGSSAERGNRSIFTVHRQELLDQTYDAFMDACIVPGVIAPGVEYDPDFPIHIAMLPTLIRRLDQIERPDLIVMDEAAHAVSPSWAKLTNHWSDSKLVGLTATPTRMDGKGLGDVFESMVTGPTVEWLIENKFLSTYRAFTPSLPDTAGLHIEIGDYARSELVGLMDKPTITGDAIGTYLKHAMGRKAIVFCASITHSQSVRDAFKAAGISCEHLDSGSGRTERKAVMDRYRAGEIDVLTNVDLFTEGLDVPGIEVMIDLRPTMSLALHRQKIGRVLRYVDGKTALILDHAGNLMKHGLPDEEPVWSLAGVEKKSRKSVEKAMAIRQCMKCYAVSKATASVCSCCGEEFKVKPRKIKVGDGELIELTPEQRKVLAIQRKIEQQQARTDEQLVALARKRGYKNPHGWAWRIQQVRGNRGNGYRSRRTPRGSFSFK